MDVDNIYCDLNWPPSMLFKDFISVRLGQQAHDLKEEIERKLNEILPQSCKTIIKNFKKRVQMC